MDVKTGSPKMPATPKPAQSVHIASHGSGTQAPPTAAAQIDSLATKTFASAREFANTASSFVASLFPPTSTRTTNTKQIRPQTPPMTTADMNEVRKVLVKQLVVGTGLQAEGNFDGALIVFKAVIEQGRKHSIDMKDIVMKQTDVILSSILLRDFASADLLIEEANHFNWSHAMAWAQVKDVAWCKEYFKTCLEHRQESPSQFPPQGQQKFLTAIMAQNDASFAIAVVQNIHLAGALAVDYGPPGLAAEIFKQVRVTDQRLSVSLPSHLLPPPPYSLT